MYHTLKKRKKIGEILVERGALSLSDLSLVLGESENVKERFGCICLRRSLITEEDLAQTLAEQFGMEYINVKGFKMDEAVLEMFPADSLFRHQFVPLEKLGEDIIVAIADPADVIMMDELEFLAVRPLVFRVATESAIKSVLEKSNGTGRVLKGVSEDFYAATGQGNR